MEETRVREWAETVTVDMMVNEPDVCRRILAKRYAALKIQNKNRQTDMDNDNINSLHVIGTNDSGRETGNGETQADPFVPRQ